MYLAWGSRPRLCIYHPSGASAKKNPAKPPGRRREKLLLLRCEARIISGNSKMQAISADMKSQSVVQNIRGGETPAPRFCIL